MSRTILTERERLGKAIEAHRRSIGMTQQQFAQKLEVAESTVGIWEAGRTEPRRADRKRIFALRKEEASPLPTRERKTSSEDAVRALAALELILERAPREIVKSVVDYLTRRAEDYGLHD